MPANDTNAPVALFAFRRPRHTEVTLAALLQNVEAADTDLIVFIDGARSIADEPLIDSVYDIVSTTTGFRSVTIHRRSRNLGLSQSLVSGITEVVSAFGRVIVLEDDIQVSRFFLRYMNEHLALYKDDPLVASIHAAVYPHDVELPSTFFIRGADCWGWATWSRAWEHFEPDGAKLLKALEEERLSPVFDFNRTAPFTRMLRDQVLGQNDSWAIRWQAATFLKEMLTLYPDRAMAVNFGEDGSGTHGGVISAKQELADEAVTPIRIPIEESQLAREAFQDYFRVRHPMNGSLAGRVLIAMLRPIWQRMPAEQRAAVSRLYLRPRQRS